MAARNAFLGITLFLMAAWAVAEGSPIPVVESGSPVSVQSSPNVVAQSAVTQVSSVAQPGLLLNQLESLQREVMELRGVAEEQANAIDRIQKENRDRYLDLDRRISQLSGKIGSATTQAPVLPEVGGVPSVAGEPVKPVVSPRPVGQLSNAGNELYQKTFQLIRGRKFTEALVGLNRYLKEYPKGPFADNAQYWLGEVYLAQGQLEQSRDAFLALTKTYPLSDKLGDAVYKLGQVYDRLGDQAKAREYLQKAVNNFPGSSAARLADVYLQGLSS